MNEDKTVIFLAAILGIGFLAYLIHMKDKTPGVAGISLTKADLVSALKEANNSTSNLPMYNYKNPEGSDF